MTSEQKCIRLIRRLIQMGVPYAKAVRLGLERYNLEFWGSEIEGNL